MHVDFKFGMIMSIIRYCLPKDTIDNHQMATKCPYVPGVGAGRSFTEAHKLSILKLAHKLVSVYSWQASINVNFTDEAIAGAGGLCKQKTANRHLHATGVQWIVYFIRHDLSLLQWIKCLCFTTNLPASNFCIEVWVVRGRV